MSYKDANRRLDDLYEELTILCEAKDNSETYEDYIYYEVQIAELEVEIEQIEKIVIEKPKKTEKKRGITIIKN